MGPVFHSVGSLLFGCAQSKQIFFHIRLLLCVVPSPFKQFSEPKHVLTPSPTLAQLTHEVETTTCPSNHLPNNEHISAYPSPLLLRTCRSWMQGAQSWSWGMVCLVYGLDLLSYIKSVPACVAQPVANSVLEA